MSERYENIQSLIKKINPDIFCAQELTVNWQPNNGISVPQKLAESLGYHYCFAPGEVQMITGKRLSFGNAIFTKYPIISHRVVPLWGPLNLLSLTLREKRTYLEVKVDVDGKSLTVATTHLSWHPFFALTRSRKREANKIIKNVRKSVKPYLLAGDFNHTPDSYLIRVLASLLKPAGPPYEQLTFPTKLYQFMGVGIEKLKWRLDYVFVSPDVRVNSSKILKTKYSDHLPIVADIKL